MSTSRLAVLDRRPHPTGGAAALRGRWFPRGLATAMAAVAVALAALVAGAVPASSATLPTATDKGLLGTTPLIPSLSRDCGFSTPLSDGNYLWIYCDSYYTSNTGTLHATLHNSAAFASGATRTTMQDETYNFYGEYNLNANNPNFGGLNFIAVPANPVNFPCTGGTRKNWPRSAVTIPGGGPNGTDKVLIWYSRVCDQTLNQGVLTYVQNGVGLAEFDYTPGSFNAATGPTVPTVASRIVNDNLFGATTPWGNGALTKVISGTTYVYSYRCTTRYCWVARVNQASAGTASAYQYWNGSTWGSSAIAMSLPGDSLPVSEVNVQWVPQANKYVMVYTPCTLTCQVPWFDRVAIRTSANPQGPWTAASNTVLPGCTTDWNTTPCNSTLGHVELSTTDLGISYSRRTAGGPPPGRVHWGTIPLTVITSAK